MRAWSGRTVGRQCRDTDEYLEKAGFREIRCKNYQGFAITCAYVVDHTVAAVLADGFFRFLRSVVDHLRIRRTGRKLGSTS
jgi:hypothetical protein